MLRSDYTLCPNKNVTTLSCHNSDIQELILIIFGTNVTEKVGYFIFSPHLTSASELSGETGNPEITSFQLNAVCFLSKHTQNIKIGLS